MARIQAVLRRARPAVERLTMGAIAVDFVALKAWREAREFHLTHREFEVLRYLAERPGLVVSRDELLREVWGACARKSRTTLTIRATSIPCTATATA